jgi:transcriptional regulator with XRE-family HTH domain
MATALQNLRAKARVHRELPSPKVCRMIREQAGLSQNDIADALGVSRVAVTRWENGARRPRGRLLRRYARLLEEIAKEVAR